MPHSCLPLVANHAWLMTSDALDTLVTVADRQGDVEALETRQPPAEPDAVSAITRTWKDDK